MANYTIIKDLDPVSFAGNPVTLGVVTHNMADGGTPRPFYTLFCEIFDRQPYSNLEPIEVISVQPTPYSPGGRLGEAYFDLSPVLSRYVSPALHWPPTDRLSGRVDNNGVAKFWFRIREGYGIPFQLQEPMFTTPKEYYAIPGGFDEETQQYKLYEANTSALAYLNRTKMFLTSQPCKKRIHREGHEFLRFFNAYPTITDYTIEVSERKFNGDTVTRDITEGIMQPYKPYTFNASPSLLRIAPDTISYTYQLKNSNGDVSEKVMYVFSEEKPHALRQFIFQNSLGGFDTLYCKGDRTLTAQGESQRGFVAMISSHRKWLQPVQQRKRINTLFKGELGSFTQAELLWLVDFFITERACLVEGDKLLTFTNSMSSQTINTDNPPETIDIEGVLGAPTSYFTQQIKPKAYIEITMPVAIKYGLLYNGYFDSVNPDMPGWRLPTQEDFEDLTTQLQPNAGGKLKETGLTYWNSPNTAATNEAQFNGRGAGTRISGFSNLKQQLLLKGAERSDGFESGTGFNGLVHDMVENKGKLYCVGDFTEYNGVPCSYIISLNSDGTVNTSFDISAGFDVYALAIAVFNNQLYVSGDFSYYKGSRVYRICRIDLNGSLDGTFLPPGGLNAPAKTMLVYNEMLLLGGLFTQVNGQTHNYIVSMRLNGSINSGFNSGVGFDDVVEVIRERNGLIYVGGVFNRYNGTTCGTMVVLLNNGTILPLSAGLVQGEVIDMAIDSDNGDIYLGGDVYEIDGETVFGIGALNVDLTGKTSFNSNRFSLGDVHSIAITDKVYITGSFVDAPPANSNGLLSFNKDGTYNLEFNSGTGLDETGRKILILGGRLFVAGLFSKYNGESARGIVSINPDGSHNILSHQGAALNHNSADMQVVYMPITQGAAVRLVKDITPELEHLPQGEVSVRYIGNDEKQYRCVRIGNRIWTADNLAETKNPSGEWIKGYEEGELTTIPNMEWEGLRQEALCAYNNIEANIIDINFYEDV